MNEVLIETLRAHEQHVLLCANTSTDAVYTPTTLRMLAEVLANAATALATQQPQGVPEDVQSIDFNFIFHLIKECRSHVRRTGIQGDDYGLCHESRMLALRYERGDFAKAMGLCRTLAAAPSPERQG